MIVSETFHTCNFQIYCDFEVTTFTNQVYFRNNGTVKFLTKGDNNSVDDRGLYAPGQLWLTKSDVVGRARGFLPYVGMVTILMNEYPKFKVNRSCWKHHSLICLVLVCCVGLPGLLRTDAPRMKMILGLNLLTFLQFLYIHV